MMPKGYAIFTEVITDQDRYEGYVQKALPTIAQYDGQPLVVHDDPQVIEGQWFGTRIVILEFDSVDKARNWYNSIEYQAIVSERHASAQAHAIIVSEYEMPGT